MKYQKYAPRNLDLELVDSNVQLESKFYILIIFKLQFNQLKGKGNVLYATKVRNYKLSNKISYITGKKDIYSI